jgi:hypothetical protein
MTLPPIALPKNKNQAQIKNELEIQYVHDVLECALIEDPLHLSSAESLYGGGAHDALAWVLGLPCGRRFGVDFAKLVTQLKAAGIELVDTGMVTTSNPLTKTAS